MRRAFPWVLAAVLAGCGRRPAPSSAYDRDRLYLRLCELREGLTAEQNLRDALLATDDAGRPRDEWGRQIDADLRASMAWTLRKMRDVQAEIDRHGAREP